MPQFPQTKELVVSFWVPGFAKDLLKNYVLLNRLCKALEAGTNFLIKYSKVTEALEILYSANSEKNSIFPNYPNAT